MDINTATPTQRNNRTLVLALGNLVMTDDSAGLVALGRFKEKYAMPEGVDLLDGGTLGLDLLCYMEGYKRILIVDCVMRSKNPGEVVIVEAEEIETVFANCLSPHQMGLKDLIAVLRLQGRMPEQMTVVGIEGEVIDLGTEVTASVAGAIGEAAETMAGVLRSWGIGLTPLNG
jgi:hydrogenase maturation protease